MRSETSYKLKVTGPENLVRAEKLTNPHDCLLHGSCHVEDGCCHAEKSQVNDFAQRKLFPIVMHHSNKLIAHCSIAQNLFVLILSIHNKNFLFKDFYRS